MLARIEARLLALVELAQGGLAEHERDTSTMSDAELYQFGLYLRRMHERLEHSEEARKSAREEAACARRRWLRTIARLPAPPCTPVRVVPEETWPDLPPGWRWQARWQATHDDGTTTATYNDPAPVVRLAQKHTPVELPPRPEAPETLFDIDDYTAPQPGGGIRAVQGR
jgi:hypothetical protein